MLDWRALEPLSAEALLKMAAMAVLETRRTVDVNARISHVGFRSHDRLEWENLMAVMKDMGEMHLTFKPDGRQVPFFKLHKPLAVGAEQLHFVELPATRPMVGDEPVVVVVYHTVGEDRPVHVRSGIEVREQSMTAEDFIERDKGRAQ